VSDERTLVAGTAANVIGLVFGVVAALGIQILLGRTLAPGAFGLVTVAVQVAFVASAGARFGMDMAAVRLVAIGRGTAASDHLRSLVDRCVLVAAGASVLVAAAVAAASPLYGDYGRVVALGAVSIPFIAVTNVYLGATRGLRQMRQTLYVFWIGQPLLWIAFAGVAIASVSTGSRTDAAVLAYDASWTVAAIAAALLWRREARPFGQRPATRDEVRAAVRFGALRAPGAALAQAVFWVDLWVLASFKEGVELDAYAGAARVSQVLLLFLTSLSLVFSPFVADLHARGERERLDELFKRSTRWALTATIPLLVVLFVAAPDVLHAFSPRFEIGDSALRILLVGQMVNVATGSVGFILIMAGHTGLDLLDNALAVVLIGGLAVIFTPAFGIEGTAAAAAIGISTANLVRLVQVRRKLGIQPYDASYVRLILPSAGVLAASLAAHAALELSWWGSLAVTAVFGVAVYVALLPLALPRDERAAIARRWQRLRDAG
jgi:O-antigen/teichoic acid export membrane protein